MEQKLTEFQSAANAMEKGDFKAGQELASNSYNDLGNYTSSMQESIKDYEGLQKAINSIGKETVRTYHRQLPAERYLCGLSAHSSVQRGPRHLMFLNDLERKNTLEDSSGINQSQD